jgi:hypothetical protein
MTGLEALKALLDGKVARISRKNDDDMSIIIDEEGQLSLSDGYDFYIQDEFQFDLRFGSPGAIVEHFYNDLLKDDWEAVE